MEHKPIGSCVFKIPCEGQSLLLAPGLKKITWNLEIIVNPAKQGHRRISSPGFVITVADWLTTVQVSPTSFFIYPDNGCREPATVMFYDTLLFIPKFDHIRNPDPAPWPPHRTTR